MEIHFSNNERFLRLELLEWLNENVGKDWVYINRNSMGIIDIDKAFLFWFVWG